jgi:hypothetical protein
MPILMLLTVMGLAACKEPAAEVENPAAAPASAESTAPAAAMPEETGPVTYRVELTSLWTKERFPFEYPDGSLIHRPHFSGLIGTAHDEAYHLFAPGQAPTPGLERLSETGKHEPLDAEIRAAITAGHALALTESDPLKDFSQTVTAEVTVDAAHPMVSLAAMVAPSPDWFAGVADVNLMQDGAWVASKTVDVAPWDSGGDNGQTYLADDAEADPKQPTSAPQGRHFVRDGAVMPVARITFTRI